MYAGRVLPIDTSYRHSNLTVSDTAVARLMCYSLSSCVLSPRARPRKTLEPEIRQGNNFDDPHPTFGVCVVDSDKEK